MTITYKHIYVISWVQLQSEICVVVNAYLCALWTLAVRLYWSFISRNSNSLVWRFRNIINMSSYVRAVFLKSQREKTCVLTCTPSRHISDCASMQYDWSFRCSHKTFHSCLSKTHPVKTLIRLCKWADWSESTLGTNVRKYVFWRSGSNICLMVEQVFWLIDR